MTQSVQDELDRIAPTGNLRDKLASMWAMRYASMPAEDITAIGGYETIAANSYRFADAMLTERGNPNSISATMWER